MYKLLLPTRLLLLAVLVLGLGLLSFATPATVLAQDVNLHVGDAPTIDVFEDYAGCNSNQPGACDCTYLIKDTDTGYIRAFSGSSNPDNVASLITILPEGNFQWSVLAHAWPDDQKNNCYTEQYESSQAVNGGTGIEDAIAACAVGAAVGSVAPVGGTIGGCTSGASAVLLAPIAGNLASGDWVENGMKSNNPVVNGNSSCGWDDEANFTITRWTDVSDGFAGNKYSILNFQGQSGSGVTDPFLNDTTYCSLMIVKESSEVLGELLAEKVEDEEELEEIISGDNINAFGSPDGITGEPFELCKQIPEANAAEKAACESCAQITSDGGEDGDGVKAEGIWTALGCISTDPTEGIGQLVTIGLGMGGGVALMTTLAASFKLVTSQGNPQKTGEAKELMQSAVIGLLFVIMSTTLLQFFARDLLRIPGFGG